MAFSVLTDADIMELLTEVGVPPTPVGPTKDLNEDDDSQKQLTVSEEPPGSELVPTANEEPVPTANEALDILARVANVSFPPPDPPQKEALPPKKEALAASKKEPDVAVQKTVVAPKKRKVQPEILAGSAMKRGKSSKHHFTEAEDEKLYYAVMEAKEAIRVRAAEGKVAAGTSISWKSLSAKFPGLEGRQLEGRWNSSVKFLQPASTGTGLVSVQTTPEERLARRDEIDQLIINHFYNVTRTKRGKRVTAWSDIEDIALAQGLKIPHNTLKNTYYTALKTAKLIRRNRDTKKDPAKDLLVRFCLTVLEAEAESAAAAQNAVSTATPLESKPPSLELNAEWMTGGDMLGPSTPADHGGPIPDNEVAALAAKVQAHVCAAGAAAQPSVTFS